MKKTRAVPKEKISYVLVIVLFDIIMTYLCAYLAIALRLELIIDSYTLKNYLSVAGIDALITIWAMMVFGLYSSMWEFVSYVELRRLLFAVTSGAVVRFVLYKVLLHLYIPSSWFVLEPFLLYTATSLVRLAYREVLILFNREKSDEEVSRVMLVGAGQAGHMILKEINSSDRLHKKVVCMIDDDLRKQGLLMNGIRVVGTRHDIIDKSKEYEIDEIYITMPSASRKDRQEIATICSKTSCELKVLPGLYQMINDEVAITKLRNVEIADLLGRDPVEIDLKEIDDYLHGRRVMVTGGGGSIGSELCRQIACYRPSQLIIVDIYENNAYDIEMELRRNLPELNLDVVIASVRDLRKMERLFERYHPDIVFHAAAHKHVPLMERAPDEAIKNNVLGTWNVAQCAHRYHVKRFILISTDKAVNPTNIMGASKRMCEMVIQYFNELSETNYAAVRFGNVLGSNGSVIPLFKKQIADGGPVTVTDPDIIRFFMTVNEAVSLVLQASLYALGGEIFVLDMGDPVKIDDLAHNLIRLSGYIPNEDIQIVYTGLRPGEKLYEEILMEEEGLGATKNGSIFVSHQIEFDTETFASQVADLETHLNDDVDIKKLVGEIVDTYTPQYEG